MVKKLLNQNESRRWKKLSRVKNLPKQNEIKKGKQESYADKLKKNKKTLILRAGEETKVTLISKVLKLQMDRLRVTK